MSSRGGYFYPVMRNRLHAVLMASTVIATSLSFTTPYVHAQARTGGIVSSTDDDGRKVFTNDSPSAPSASAARKQAAPAAPGNGLVYWSPKDKKWKSVPNANVRAARTAAAEVNSSLGREATQSQDIGFTRKPFTEKEIDAAIEQAASKHNVDANLVRSVIKVESNFNPNAVSRKGAMGLMQLMPQTARQLRVRNPFDPEQNVDAGVRHLKQLMENYNGDVKLTLAAYNAGAGAVRRSAGIPHFAETRNYVRRITDLYNNGGNGWNMLSNPLRSPLRVQRDERGVLYISNVD
ncbi:MAG TPA: lytic transglycosylase domain-containing protein [Terriglobales bacterium]|nr:lytic transglycosylase domain-containing protein [Terriglobales bacterium]